MNHDFLIGSAQLNQAFESQESSGCGAHGSGIPRRSFIKRIGGATVATVVAWNMFEATANAAPPNQSHESKKLVKIKRVWNVVSDGASGTGTGTGDDDTRICLAYAIQDLLDNLESQNHITRTETVHSNEWVPQSWVLQKILKIEEGEQTPGALAFTQDPFLQLPDTDYLDGKRLYPIYTVWGRIPATNSVLTLRWVWGPPSEE